MLDTKPYLITTDFPPLHRGKLDTLQVNLGYKCNLSCTHCHVNAGPNRLEMMEREIVDLVLEVLDRQQISSLDLTGGAPEMNPHFKHLVSTASKKGVQVIDRCNLSILEEDGYEDIAPFMAEHQVSIVASLPCYEEENVDKQRGKGTYNQSIRVLQKLNSLGYGQVGSGLSLHLVYNPDGFHLPPQQQPLEAEYKAFLSREFNIVFNDLFAIANMPISRFGSRLLSAGKFEEYMSLLKDNFSQTNIPSLMCRNQVSVDWQGNLYDCDFNQMLDMPVKVDTIDTPHIKSLLKSSIGDAPIQIGDHCYGCTAGQGSSCGGSLSGE